MRAEIQHATDLLQRGDAHSLEQALTLLQNAVFSFSMRVCGHREDAEDTMQEVIVKSVSALSFGGKNRLDAGDVGNWGRAVNAHLECALALAGPGNDQTASASLGLLAGGEYRPGEEPIALGGGSASQADE
jgi:hypothetical protein